MGLIILGIVTVSLFFPFSRRAFGGIRITAPWAFAIIACFAVGVVVPTIVIAGRVDMSVAGFVLPALIMLALIPALVIRKEVGRGVVAELAVTAIVTLFSVVVPVETAGWQTVWAIACGVSVGALVFLIAHTPLCSTFAAAGGLVLGNIVYGFISYYAYGSPVFRLGQPYIYNAFFIAAAVALSVCEAATGASRATGRRNASRRSIRFEAGEDGSFDDEIGNDELF